VIEAAAQRASWQPNAKGDGARGRGFAFSRTEPGVLRPPWSADVTTASRGKGVMRRVRRSMRAIVNPDASSIRFEGGIIQSASWTLMSRGITPNPHGASPRNPGGLPDHPLRGRPQVEVVLLRPPRGTVLGVGEGLAGPGRRGNRQSHRQPPRQRLRALSFAPERVKQALA